MRDDDPAKTDSPKRAPSDAPRSAGGGLLRSTSIVSGMTFLSRILGLVRDVVFAKFFGAGILMDAFFIANRIPNMLRRFSAEGAFSQGFVPVMARYRERHQHAEAREFIDAMAGTLGLILFGITVVGVLAAPLLVTLVAPGFVGDDGRFDLAALMVRFTFPYLFFVSLVAFAGGILNTYGRFAVPAFTPVLLNVCLIGFAIYVSPRLDNPVMALAYAVLAAGVVQLLFQLPFLARLGVIPRPRFRPRHEGVRRVGSLMLPAIFGSSVAQLNVLLGGVIASFLGVGKISWLYYSDRLMEFPLGLFGIALATVTLPHLSRQHTNSEGAAFAATVDWSMKLVVLIAVPAALGLIVMAQPIVAAIFYGGEFSTLDVEFTALSLQAFAVGLIGFSFVKILAPAFFAREDTRTPVKVGLIALAVNLVLSIVFAIVMTRLGLPATHAGLALAISIAALLNAWLLYRGLQRDSVIHHSQGWMPLLIQCALANVLMVAVLLVMSMPLASWLELSVWNRSLALLGHVLAGASTYAVVLFAMGLRPSSLRLQD